MVSSFGDPGSESVENFQRPVLLGSDRDETRPVDCEGASVLAGKAKQDPRDEPSYFTDGEICEP